MKRTPLTIHSLFHEYKHAWIFWIYLLLGYQFGFTEKIVKNPYFISCRADSLIPFVPAFVIPYVLWFPLIALVLIVLCFSDRSDFLKCIILLYLGFEIAMLIYLVFPNGQQLRPKAFGNDIFSQFLQNVIYANDTNTNCCPSIHVLNQLAILIGFYKSKLGRAHRGWSRALLITSVFVCASTVFVKQHSLIDVIAACALECVLYPLVYKVNWRKLVERVRSRRKAISE